MCIWRNGYGEYHNENEIEVMKANTKMKWLAISMVSNLKLILWRRINGYRLKLIAKCNNENESYMYQAICGAGYYLWKSKMKANRRLRSYNLKSENIKRKRHLKIAKESEMPFCASIQPIWLIGCLMRERKLGAVEEMRLEENLKLSAIV